jgi:hypothetical protein
MQVSKMTVAMRFFVDIQQSANSKKKARLYQVPELEAASGEWAAHDCNGSFKDNDRNPSMDYIYLMKGVGGPGNINKMHSLAGVLCGEFNKTISRGCTYRSMLAAGLAMKKPVNNYRDPCLLKHFCSKAEAEVRGAAQARVNPT